jgi:hypothetical protein
MRSPTISRKSKLSGICTECGQSSKALHSAPTRVPGVEVYLCSSCATWRKTAEQLRVGYWSALLPPNPKANPRP